MSLVLAKLHFANKDFVQAEKKLVEHLTSSPNDIAALKVLAQVYEERKKPDKAIESYIRCYTLDPERKSVLLDICRILRTGQVTLEPDEHNKWVNLAAKAFPTNRIVGDFKPIKQDQDMSLIVDKLESIFQKLSAVDTRLEAVEKTLSYRPKVVETPPLSQPLSQPVSQPVSQPISQPLSQPVFQPFSQPLSQSLSKPFFQSLSQPAPEPASQPVSQSLFQPFSQAASEPASQPVSQSLFQPLSQAAPKPDSQPVSQSLFKPLPQAASEPASQPISQSLFQPLSQAAPKPDSQPVSQSLFKPLPQAASKPASQSPPQQLSQPIFTFGNVNIENIANNSEQCVEEENLPEIPEVVCDMKPIEVKTGEEDEDVVFAHRCKLYRFRDKEFKERGTGEIKVLKHKTTQKTRLVMRREQIGLVCLNCFDVSRITRMAETKITFSGLDISDGEVEPTRFYVRFKYESTTDAFEKQLRDLFENQNPKITASSQQQLSDIELIKPKLDQSLVDKARQLMLPDLFYHDTRGPNSKSSSDDE